MPLQRSVKRCAKCGHAISPIHFTQPSTQLLGKNWSFSSEARYTVTRITLFRFADTTSASVPQSKDFPGVRESASPPRSTKINVPAASAPRTAKLYHLPSPRVNRHAQTGILPRQFSVPSEGNGNVGIPSGCQPVYRDARVGLPGWGMSVYRPRLSR